MPRAKKPLSQYPTVYFDLFAKAIADNGHIIGNLKNQNEAYNLRRDIYKFRRAAEAEKVPEAHQWLSFPIYIEPVIADAPNGKWQIRIATPDESKEARLVAASLEGAEQ